MGLAHLNHARLSLMDSEKAAKMEKVVFQACRDSYFASENVNAGCLCRSIQFSGATFCDRVCDSYSLATKVCLYSVLSC